MDDLHYMKMALELAARGVGYTSPNPMVGAVVVKDDRVVGRGYHAAVGKPHAEVMALDDAGDLARKATLYVTLEPCNHFGRTPPCTQRVLASGVKRVVVAMADPNPAVTGGGTRWLRDQGVMVDVGVLEAEALQLNEVFVKYVTTGHPFVYLKCAATLDGRIATRTGDARWVTGPEARQHVHRLRHAVDAILVGVETVRRDDPSLTTRLEGENGLDPIRVILDTRLSTPEQAKVLQLKSKSVTLFVCSENAAPEKCRTFTDLGSEVLTAPLAPGGGIDLERLMPLLGARGITSVLIEGGARVIGSALRSRIVDKINFFYAPKILGGDDGVPICSGAGPDKMNDCLAVEDVRVQRYGPDVMVEGYLRKSPTRRKAGV